MSQHILISVVHKSVSSFYFASSQHNQSFQTRSSSLGYWAFLQSRELIISNPKESGIENRAKKGLKRLFSPTITMRVQDELNGNDLVNNLSRNTELEAQSLQAN